MRVFQQPVKGIQTLPREGYPHVALDEMLPLNIFVRNEGAVMKLLLVSPSHKFGKKVLKAIKIPQLSLHILASLTPNDVDITVVDEEIREIGFSSDFDLVGISCMTATANRSYQLSDMYRQRGSKKSGIPRRFGPMIKS